MSINKILMSIKGHNSVKIDQKKKRALYTTWILYISMHIQNFIKNHPFGLKILRKNTLHQSRAITLLYINSPFAIPNHSSPISMSRQNLKKIGQKLLKLESGNEALTGGRTNGRTLKRFGGYSIIPRHKKNTLEHVSSPEPLCLLVSLYSIGRPCRPSVVVVRPLFTLFSKPNFIWSLSGMAKRKFV